LEWQLEAIKNLGGNPKKFMDLVSTHLYPPGADPYNPSHDTRAFNYHDELIVPYRIELWNTETGPWCDGIYQGANSNYRTTDAEESDTIGKDDADYYRGFNFEAERMAYNFLHSIGNGMTGYFYYDARLFAGPDYYDTHCTIFHYDDTIRTKGITYAVLAWLFDHSKGLGNITSIPTTPKGLDEAAKEPTPKTAIPLGSSTMVYAYLFDRQGVPLVALWSADTKNRNLTLASIKDKVKAYDLMGNEMELADGVVPVGRTPVYLEGQDGLTVAQMKVAVQQGRLIETTDQTPPNLSISECPRGRIDDTDIRVRWIAPDDTYVVEPRHLTGDYLKGITYSYRLVGRDKDWSDWTSKVVAFYHDLQPGDYRLEVKAKDGTGNVSATVAREFTVRGNAMQARAE
jgi:hypothetical protein